MNLKDKQNLYKSVLDCPAGAEIIRDLNAFCYGTKTTMRGQVDALELARREGRREVFLQLMRMLKVDVHEMYDTYVDDDMEF